MENIKVGDIVRYAQPEAGEEIYTFIVREVNGDRVLLLSRDFPDTRITPMELIALTDITPV